MSRGWEQTKYDDTQSGPSESPVCVMRSQRPGSASDRSLILIFDFDVLMAFDLRVGSCLQRTLAPLAAAKKQRGIYSEYLGKSTASARKVCIRSSSAAYFCVLRSSSHRVRNGRLCFCRVCCTQEATHGPVARPTKLAAIGSGSGSGSGSASTAPAPTPAPTVTVQPIPPANLFQPTATYRKPKISATAAPVVDAKVELEAARRSGMLRGPHDPADSDASITTAGGRKKRVGAGAAAAAAGDTKSAPSAQSGLTTTSAGATAAAANGGAGDAGAAGAAGAADAVSEPPKLEPKVLVSHVQRAGQPPRRIEIERKKRLYATQPIEELLRREGVDYTLHSAEVDHETGRPSYLALEIFDDTEYESRTPHEWVALGTDPNTGITQVRGKGLRFERKNGAGRWVDCVMNGYDKKEDKFNVKWVDNGHFAKLFRIHVIFEVPTHSPTYPPLPVATLCTLC